MKLKKTHIKAVALTALGVVLGRGAQAETVLNFDAFPPGQAMNAQIIQSYGGNAVVPSEGIAINGFGTPNIGVTWQATGGRWDFYIDSVWSAGQLDSSQIGDRHEVVFTPNSPNAAVVIKSFNFHPYYMSTERYTYDVSVLSGGNVVAGPQNISFVAASAKHPVTINYTGGAGQTLVLRMARVAATLEPGEVDGIAGNIAVDDIVFAQVPEVELPTGPAIVSLSPTNNQVAVAPAISFRASLTNGTTALVASTIQLKLNGIVVPHNATQAEGLTTVTYDAPDLLPSLSSNQFLLTYSDTSTPVKSYSFLCCSLRQQGPARSFVF